MRRRGPTDRPERGVHAGRVRAPGPVQLLSQRQSVCRFRADQFGDHRAGSQPDQRRSALGYFLCEGHAQREGRRHLSANVSQRERPASAIIDPSSAANADGRGWQRRASTCRRGVAVSDAPCTTLLPVRPDTREAGAVYVSRARDVKELSLYVQDTITKGSWSFNLGIRGDLYNGLSTAREAEPRAGRGVQHQADQHGAAVSYARTLETPFNENLIIATTGCNVPVIARADSLRARKFSRGIRATNFTPACSRRLENIWSSTANTSGSTRTTPTTSACWATRRLRFRSSGTIPRFRDSAARQRARLPRIHGAGGDVQRGGALFSAAGGRSGRDRRARRAVSSASTTTRNSTRRRTCSISRGKRGPWVGFNWRYDSGLVAGAVPDYATALTFDGDQQAAIGLFCGGDVCDVECADNQLPGWSGTRGHAADDSR